MRSAIFSVSGLRGVINQDLTPEVIYRYCEAFSEFIGGKKIIIGRDNRPSSYYLAQDVYWIFSQLGYEVYNLGVAPTPMTVFLTKKLQADGGIEITASHNPENWNGLKFISGAGRFFYEEELTEFKKIIRHKRLSKPYSRAKSAEELLRISKNFVVINEQAVEEYLQAIILARYFQNIKPRSLRIGIDCNNGATEFLIQRLLTKLGHQVFPLNPPCYGFCRAPEPTPENLSALARFVRVQKLDFGIAFDPDGDRVAFVDEKGIPLSEEQTLLLAILYLFPKWSGPVVVNNATSMAVEELSAKFQFSVYRTKIGEANVIKKIEEVDALVGGEGNGGVILPEINKARDGILASAIVVNLISQSGNTLSEIRKSLPKYYMAKQVIYVYNKDWQSLLKKKLKMATESKIDMLDGIKIISKDHWLLVRKSNTEPALRIIVEGKSKKQIRQLITEIINLLAR